MNSKLLEQKNEKPVCFALVCMSVCVCLSVTTITKKIVDGFVPNFMQRFLGEREDQVRVSLRSVEGCGSNGRKLRKPAIVYVLYF